MTVSNFAQLSERSVELGPCKSTPAADRQWQHWHLARDPQNLAWLVMDKRDTSANVLSEAVLTELDQILDSLHQDLPEAVIVRSAKAGNFCVGADINEFTRAETAAQVEEKISWAHAVVQKLVDLPCTTIAVVHGQTLGGGLELALCCDLRLAIPGASLGTPEIKLGLHPGLGGTARLCHLMDPLAAMTMMLTGKNTPAKKAKAQGLVDQIVEERHLLNAIAAVVAGQLKPRKRHWRGKLFQFNAVRRLAGKKMRQQAAEKAPPEHFPAPEALISLWEEHGNDADKLLKEEVKSFARLMMTDTSRNLVRVFFLREKMKGLTTDKTTAEAAPIRQVHVIGAGAMGGDIAGWCALQGLRVTLFDTQPEVIAKAIGKTTQLCGKKHLSSAEARDVLDRLIPDFDNKGIGQADLVLEAVPEKIEIKQKVYAEVEPKLKADAILATNTSSIPLEKLQEGLQDPNRLVGIHFFNPVALMQLVEVVQHSNVSDTTLARVRRFVGQISRLPVPVTSAPGFLVNRALTPYLVEALTLLDEGVAAESIDQVALDFGMPMGPIELADQVGLDICLGVAVMLRERLDSKLPDAPEWLRQKVDDGNLGSKTGQGLYTWQDGKPDKKADTAQAPDDTLDRLVLPMLNACMACLREQVIADAELLDGAMIFGTGFAPFRGGPLHYAQRRGYSEIKDRLNQLAASYGQRFAADAGWDQ